MSKSNIQKGAENQALSDDKIQEIAETKKKQRNNISIEKTCTAKKNEIAEIVKHTMAWFNRPIVKTDTECAERLTEFFQTMCETGEIPTVEKMALALGTTRKTLWEWQTGSQGTERARLIGQAKEMLASMDAELVQRNKIPAVPYIFRAKNYYGMTDTTEISVSTTPNLLGDDGNREELAAKYSEAVADLPGNVIDVESNE